MSEVTDTLGTGELVEALGQVWTVRPLTPGIRARFSAWLKLTAKQEVLSLRRDLEPTDFAADLDRLNDRLGAGAYNWGSPLDPQGIGPAVLAALGGEAGTLRLLELLLEKDHPRLPPGQARKLMRANQDGFSAAVGAALSQDPNLGAPDADASAGAESKAA